MEMCILEEQVDVVRYKAMGEVNSGKYAIKTAALNGEGDNTG